MEMVWHHADLPPEGYFLIVRGILSALEMLTQPRRPVPRLAYGRGRR